MKKKRYDEKSGHEPDRMKELPIDYGIAQLNETADYEEDLANSLSSEELKKNMFQYIDKLFGE